MKTITKISLVCVFSGAAAFGFKTILDGITVKKPDPQTIVTGEICTARSDKVFAAKAPVSESETSVTAAVIAADQTLDEGEEIMTVPAIMHHPQREKLVSTVDVPKALSMAGQGTIGFVDGALTATVSVMDEDGESSHDFTFGFDDKGAICDENSPICSTMDVISQEEKAKLTATLCERVTGPGGVTFYQKICTPKP